MSERITAAQAMAKAERAQLALEGHERLCAERYEGIHSAINDLKHLIRWILGVMVGVVLSLLGWMAVQLYQANNARIERIDRQPVVVQQQSQGR